MSEMEKEKYKPNNKLTKQSAKKDEVSEKLDKLLDMYERLHDDLELYIQVTHILTDLLGGVAPGRKTLDSVQLVKLRNEGVKVKDLARMQGISECAMNRKLKELREVGLLRAE